MSVQKKGNTKVRILNGVSPVMLILIILGVMIFVLLIVFTSADRQVLLSAAKTMKHDGLERTYLVYESNTSGKKSLIIGLHGLGGNGRQFAYFTGLHNATNKNTIVVYPDAVRSTQKGLKSGWNSTFCCGTGLINKIDDQGFILALIEKISKDYDIDEKKVFVTGFSNGATMSQYLATNHSSVFAGVAAASGSIGVESRNLKPKSAVRILLAHGQLDDSIPYKGGHKSGEDEFFTWIDFETTVKTWREVNKCGEEIKVIEISADREIVDYKNCEANVRRVEYPNKGHQWDGWRTSNFWKKVPRGSTLVVEFFEGVSSTL